MKLLMSVLIALALSTSAFAADVAPAAPAAKTEAAAAPAAKTEAAAKAPVKKQKHTKKHKKHAVKKV